VSHINLGRLLYVRDDMENSLTSHRNAVRILEPLARENPANYGCQKLLSESHDLVGAILRRTGDAARSLESFQRALEIRRRVCEHSREIEHWIDLATSYENISLVLNEMHCDADASESRRKASASRESLSRLNSEISVLTKQRRE
jgi:tetratricopeptide (TPR) repeat protein